MPRARCVPECCLEGHNATCLTLTPIIVAKVKHPAETTPYRRRSTRPAPLRLRVERLPAAPNDYGHCPDALSGSLTTLPESDTHACAGCCSTLTSNVPEASARRTFALPLRPAATW